MTEVVLIRLFEWAYTVQSCIGIGLSVYASRDARKDMAAVLGLPLERLYRLIVWQAYALAGALGILHALLFWLGVQALLSPLALPRTIMILEAVVGFTIAQFVAIFLQSWVIRLRHKVRRTSLEEP